MNHSEYTSEQIEEFKDQFITRRRKQIVASIMSAAVIFAFLVTADAPTSALFGIAPELWMPPAIVLVVVALGFTLFNWRCPACNRYLGKTFSPAFCAKCGAPLRGGQKKQ